jgi:PIN domain nuclease of toxin-antitoxin system
VTILLDTNVFLWLISEDERLSAPGRDLFADQANKLLLSMASVWEIFIKLGTQKLILPADPEGFLRAQLRENDIGLLPVRFHHAARLPGLPKLHKDPFDRIIIAQALCEKIPVLSADPLFAEYGVKNLF